FFLFFQAEDGIRDKLVTGVQTCALPIFLLLSAAAWTGLLLGLTSVLLIHAAGRRYVSAARAWAIVVAVFALSSFGIYLGRIQRWNTWDLLLRPGELVHAGWRGALHPFDHPRPFA